MFCGKCRFEMPDDFSFCPRCGTEMPILNPQKEKNSLPLEKEALALTCQDCGGTLDVSESGQGMVMVCPFCKSIKLVPENDSVKIERIRSNALHATEIEKQKILADLQKSHLETEAVKARYSLRWKLLSALGLFFKKIFLLFGKVVIVAVICIAIILALLIIYAINQ